MILQSSLYRNRENSVTLINKDSRLKAKGKTKD